MKKITICIAMIAVLFACSKTEAPSDQELNQGNEMALKGKPGGGGGGGGNYAPTVTTANPYNISRFNANVGGNVSKGGGGTNTTEKGICFDTSPNPTTANNKFTGDPGSGSGGFLSILSGLTPNTMYYARAYATNGSVTVYGNQVSFTTLTLNCGVVGTVQDIDGNVYTAMTIGTQVWMLENLKTTHYRNGDPISHEPDVSWYNFSYGAYCNYGNDESNVATYGRLYNWYAVNDSRSLAPPGWHVATGADWTTLLNYIGGAGVAAGNLKEAGSAHWIAPNFAYPNDCNFTALPGGYRSGPVTGSLYVRGYWWSSTQTNASTAKYLMMISNEQNTVGSFGSLTPTGWDNKHFGYSVRCVMD